MLGAIAFSLLCLNPIAIDGDTIKCTNTSARFRIFGIQAPEIGQPGARASTLNLEAVMGERVRCQATGGRTYGRIVARCYTWGGRDIGRAQIQSGNAFEWCSYSKGYYGTCRMGMRFGRR